MAHANTHASIVQSRMALRRANLQSIADMDAAIAGLKTQEAETEQQLASVRALLQNQNQNQTQGQTAP